MDLYDLALKYKDFEWAKALGEYEGSLENDQEKSETEKYAEVFTETAAALEDIFNQYAVKEKDGIRNFNMFSEFDRNDAALVLVESPPYTRGETVKFHYPSSEELAQMRGVVNGYVLGYRDAFFDANQSFLALFKKKETRKKEANSKGKRTKKASNKIKDQNPTKAE